MPHVFTTKITDTKYAVQRIVYDPNILSESDLLKGVEVTEIPIPDIRPGVGAELLYNPTTSELYYEYKTVPLSSEEQLSLMQQETNVDISLVQKEKEVRERIESGNITATNFSTLSLEEQELTKIVLFKDFSPSKEDIPKALSGVEFGLVVLFKLLGKAIDRIKLTTEEQAYLDAMVNTINLNDMPINDQTDWRFQYFKQQFEGTQNTRQEYLTKKLSVTGTV